MISLTLPVKAKSIFAKGWLVDCNKTGLATLSAIIYKATPKDILTTPWKKLAFSICENKGRRLDAPNHAASKRLYFCYIDRTIHLLQKSVIASLLLSSVVKRSGCVGPRRKP